MESNQILTDKYYKIIDITDLNNNTRTDGRYPLRINSIVKLINCSLSESMIWEYIKDSNGNYKDGVLRTSLVNKIKYNISEGLLIVNTRNSIYYLKNYYRTI